MRWLNNNPMTWGLRSCRGYGENHVQDFNDDDAEGAVFESLRGTLFTKFVCGLIVAVGLTGCAGDGGGGGPYAKSLPLGSTCKSIRSELRRLDGRGVPAKVEAANAGKKLSPASRKLVDRYNQLLNDYLGARCHA